MQILTRLPQAQKFVFRAFGHPLQGTQGSGSHAVSHSEPLRCGAA